MMTLSFSTQWLERMGEYAGEPNYFIDKVWKGILHPEVHPRSEMYAYQKEYSKKFSGDWGILPQAYPKIHTIRAGNRWKEGMKIHPVINNRTKDRFQFAPTMICTGVQDIAINPYSDFRVNVDGKWLVDSDIKRLSTCDGFESSKQFFKWFDKPFKGQIIHWTDLKY